MKTILAVFAVFAPLLAAASKQEESYAVHRTTGTIRARSTTPHLGTNISPTPIHSGFSRQRSLHLVPSKQAVGAIGGAPTHPGTCQPPVTGPVFWCASEKRAVWDYNACKMTCLTNPPTTSPPLPSNQPIPFGLVQPGSSTSGSPTGGSTCTSQSGPNEPCVCCGEAHPCVMGLLFRTCVPGQGGAGPTAPVTPNPPVTATGGQPSSTTQCSGSGTYPFPVGLIMPPGCKMCGAGLSRWAFVPAD